MRRQTDRRRRPAGPAAGDVWHDHAHGRSWVCVEQVSSHPSGEPIRRWRLITSTGRRRRRHDRAGRTIVVGDRYVRAYWCRMVDAA